MQTTNPQPKQPKQEDTKMRSLGSSKAGSLVALAVLVALQTTASAMKLASDAELGKVKGMYAPGKTCKNTGSCSFSPTPCCEAGASEGTACDVHVAPVDPANYDCSNNDPNRKCKNPPMDCGYSIGGTCGPVDCAVGLNTHRSCHYNGVTPNPPANKPPGSPGLGMRSGCDNPFN